MTIFNWNRQYPCPTDKFMIDIYKSYLKFKKDVVDSWKKGVINGLMGQREYIDLVDTRLKLCYGKDGIVPILSLKPVIGKESIHILEEYDGFFKTYIFFREGLLSLVESQILLRKKDIVVWKTSELIIEYVNILKLLITSWNMGFYEKDRFEDIISSGVNPTCMTEFYTWVKNVGIDSVIGGIDEKDSPKGEPDDVLVGAFYKYVSKIQKVLDESVMTQYGNECVS